MKSTKKILIIAAIVFVVLVIVGIWFYNKSKSPAVQTTTPTKPLSGNTTSSGLGADIGSAINSIANKILTQPPATDDDGYYIGGNDGWPTLV